MVKMLGFSLFVLVGPPLIVVVIQYNV